ncbi:helix-turn-helix domain-containing protein [Candidatus Uabimicrobium sp. HlEnr_7]|uniref:helix-turn-helix domain-containing protein n=1 Tax=Candidatus Uabimicrobium helgolandensis TaxID=3095367 RepID=UPI0035582B5E
MNKKKSLTTGEVAKLCDVSIPTIHKWVRESRIKHFKMPGSGKIRIPREAIYQFMRSYGFPIDDEEYITNILIICNEKNYSEKFINAVRKNDLYNFSVVNDVFAAGMTAMQQIPDIIFIDLSLSEIDNKNFCDSIRKTVNSRNLIIVAMSNAFSSSEQRSLRRYGFNDFFEIPLKATIFKKKVQTLLKTYQQRQTSLVVSK